MDVRGDISLARALAIAAVRETFEETGLMLAEGGDIGEVANAEWAHWKACGLAPQLDRLTYFGRAITSPISPIRFHALFHRSRGRAAGRARRLRRTLRAWVLSSERCASAYADRRCDRIHAKPRNQRDRTAEFQCSDAGVLVQGRSARALRVTILYRISFGLIDGAAKGFAVNIGRS